MELGVGLGLAVLFGLCWLASLVGTMWYGGNLMVKRWFKK